MEKVLLMAGRLQRKAKPSGGAVVAQLMRQLKNSSMNRNHNGNGLKKCRVLPANSAVIVFACWLCVCVSIITAVLLMKDVAPQYIFQFFPSGKVFWWS